MIKCLFFKKFFNNILINYSLKRKIIIDVNLLPLQELILQKIISFEQ